ncbi:NAD(P)-dependent dehydrogenase (short-subunit alcohol dehydrogenase family) [Allocatelliglobosispora scoriae]|uniref:NAD(P)-dependent dehydrogenase (Short-subunit alcohol dehydrogenase family) n=1 Tax=Allocatelliglobosispora scoriae TaxID=643052 RepID=A0A841BWW1_9ACTN|nr:oxidoreductase [Allocatelliglobosispora scoriae]MBB5872165.1 NAD(P)-dependent dehydrogenase (short-subunit alcohol dehydrogenase family) [Allocatelliglobosispora scoriae]
MIDSPKVWFITGASRGLGAAVVTEALARGHRVVATGRDADAVRRAFPAADSLLALALDVTDEQSVQAAVGAAVEHFGRIDVLVNNAGRGLIGAVEEVSDSAARAVFDTNVFGVLTVQRAVLPTLRAQGSGHVINISSVGGFARAAPGWGLYASTKFALEGLTEALNAELVPLGINVTIVEPGGFRTDFLDGSSLHIEPTVIDDYAATSGLTRGIPAEHNHAQRGDPAKAAIAIVDLTEATDPPLRLQLGADSVARIEAKLALVHTELETWRKVALATDHDDVV